MDSEQRDDFKMQCSLFWRISAILARRKPDKIKKRTEDEQRMRLSVRGHQYRQEGKIEIVENHNEYRKRRSMTKTAN